MPVVSRSSNSDSNHFIESLYLQFIDRTRVEPIHIFFGIYCHFATSLSENRHTSHTRQKLDMISCVQKCTTFWTNWRVFFRCIAKILIPPMTAINISKTRGQVHRWLIQTHKTHALSNERSPLV